MADAGSCSSLLWPRLLGAWLLLLLRLLCWARCVLQGCCYGCCKHGILVVSSLQEKYRKGQHTADGARCKTKRGHSITGMVGSTQGPQGI
jgi:hypothetical protein